MNKLNFSYSFVDSVSSDASGVFQGRECVNGVVLIEQMFL
jgi:hypothetical protein